MHQFKHRLVDEFYKMLQAPAKVVIDYEDPVFVANLIAQGAVRVMQLSEENLALEHKVAEDTPKVVFHDRVIAAEDVISVGEAAKIIGNGRNRLRAFMRQIGWVTRGNEAYQERILNKHLDVKLGSFEQPVHGLKSSVTPLVADKGLAEPQKLHAVSKLH